jgi:hypothetical protein
MKKRLVLLSGIAIILAIGATSCKKDYNCVCTDSINGVSQGTTSTTINNTKSKASSACSAESTSSSSGGVTETYTCAIQ